MMDRGNGTSRRAGGRTAVPWPAIGLAVAGHLVLSGPASAEMNVRQELECLALTIYFEARGEPDEGKLAVGHVVMNRVSHPLFPKAVCDVVKQGGEKLRYRCQFTWWCDGLSDRPRNGTAWQTSMALARTIYWDYSTDPTGGALWYHAETARPIWRLGLGQGPKIGRHYFYGPADRMHKSETNLRVPVRFSAD